MNWNEHLHEAIDDSEIKSEMLGKTLLAHKQTISKLLSLIEKYSINGHNFNVGDVSIDTFNKAIFYNFFFLPNKFQEETIKPPAFETAILIGIKPYREKKLTYLRGFEKVNFDITPLYLELKDSMFRKFWYIAEDKSGNISKYLKYLFQNNYNDEMYQIIKTANNIKDGGDSSLS